MIKAWLIDSGRLALGYTYGCDVFKFYTYNDERVIRFSRQSDADRVIHLMRREDPKKAANLIPVEHIWSD